MYMKCINNDEKELDEFDWDKLISTNPFIGDLIIITNYVLRQWTNRSLCSGGYDREKLRRFDAFFGKMLKWAQRELEKGTSKYIDFINMWLYQGKIYRVQGEIMVFRKDRVEPYLRRCGIHYHNMVASWSKIYDFARFNKIYKGVEYLFIQGDTYEAIGFDVMKFCEQIEGNEDIIFRLKHEQEVIFPMSKKYVFDKEYLTPEEFVKKMDDKKDAANI